MKKREYTLLIEKDIDGYFVGSIVELPGCHTQGKTLDELLSNMKEALELYLQVKPEEKPISEFFALQRFSV